MTKKSASRQMRDKMKKDLKDNKCWDDLNNMYFSMLQLISQHANISLLAQRKDIIAMVDDKETLTINIKSLANDLRTMNDDLSKIKAMHEGKSGGSQDPDEVFNSITIYEHYRLFMERHDAVIMPTALYIIEQFDQAERKLIDANKEKELKDPNVVSDAIIIDENNAVDVCKDKSCENATADELDSIAENITTKGMPLVHESVTNPDFNRLLKSFNEIHGIQSNT